MVKGELWFTVQGSWLRVNGYNRLMVNGCSMRGIIGALGMAGKIGNKG